MMRRHITKEKACITIRKCCNVHPLVRMAFGLVVACLGMNDNVNLSDGAKCESFPYFIPLVPSKPNVRQAFENWPARVLSGLFLSLVPVL